MIPPVTMMKKLLNIRLMHPWVPWPCHTAHSPVTPNNTAKGNRVIAAQPMKP